MRPPTRPAFRADPALHPSIAGLTLKLKGILWEDPVRLVRLVGRDRVWEAETTEGGKTMSDELERNHPASDEGQDKPDDVEAHRFANDEGETEDSDDVEAHRQHGGVGR